MNSSSKIIIRFALVAEQPDAKFNSSHTADELESLANIKRFTGFVKGKDLIPLLDNASLEANPRSAKVGHVVDDIMETLDKTPELMPFKSKGILLGTADYKALQRNRFELTFNDPASEGILDGGHNALANGLFILSKVMDANELSKIKLWEEMKKSWLEHRDEIEEVKHQFDYLVPVELIVPSNVEDEHIVQQFEMSLLDICAARNNNAQLSQETKANKRGFYDDIRDKLKPDVANRVEWKSNEWQTGSGKPIKVRDLLALCWIPLNKANEADLLPISISVTPQNIYRNKGECSKQFEKLMENEFVSEARDGPRHEIHNSTVSSAFEILSDLPHLYDKIYAEFPEAYNANGFRFGANPIVKMYDPQRRANAKDKSGFVASQPSTQFTGRKVIYRYPDGLIMPLVYGLKGIMDIVGDKVVWATNPYTFIEDHLSEIAGAYRLVLDMARFDPQKLSKNQASHEFAVGEFEKVLLKTKS